MLTYPLPTGIRVVGTTRETMTLQTTLPTPVVELLAYALELAGRLTGSDKAGAQVSAICQEVISEWRAQAAATGHGEGVPE